MISSPSNNVIFRDSWQRLLDRWLFRADSEYVILVVLKLVLYSSFKDNQYGFCIVVFIIISSSRLTNPLKSIGIFRICLLKTIVNFRFDVGILQNEYDIRNLRPKKPINFCALCRVTILKFKLPRKDSPGSRQIPSAKSANWLQIGILR